MAESAIEFCDMDGDRIRLTAAGDHFELRTSDPNNPDSDYRSAYVTRVDIESFARRIISAH